MQLFCNMLQNIATKYVRQIVLMVISNLEVEGYVSIPYRQKQKSFHGRFQQKSQSTTLHCRQPWRDVKDLRGAITINEFVTSSAYYPLSAILNKVPFVIRIHRFFLIYCNDYHLRKEYVFCYGNEFNFLIISQFFFCTIILYQDLPFFI